MESSHKFGADSGVRSLPMESPHKIDVYTGVRSLPMESSHKFGAASRVRSLPIAIGNEEAIAMAMSNKTLGGLPPPYPSPLPGSGQ